MSRSTTGANVQFTPIAAPSLQLTFPNLYAFSTSFVAATSISRPKYVPSTAEPLPPYSRFEAINNGIFDSFCNISCALRNSSPGPSRYSTPPICWVLTRLVSSFSSFVNTIGQNNCPIFSSVFIDS